MTLEEIERIEEETADQNGPTPGCGCEDCEDLAGCDG